MGWETAEARPDSHPYLTRHPDSLIIAAFVIPLISLKIRNHPRTEPLFPI